MKIVNKAKGEIFYGLHFYPGVAEYHEPKSEPYRIFINEDAIRKMSKTFAGCPIFVEHINDAPNPDMDALKNEADGWVLESFFNPADGKTWVKFIALSDLALDAIKNKGFRLSNAYVPNSFGPGGLWNGVSYAKEVMDGEFEHLAIVKNPRYEESKILTPDEFKDYNRKQEIELKRLANSKDPKGEPVMSKFNFFKKAKVENSAELEGMSVTLPKSKREVTLEKLVNDADEMAENEGEEQMANGDHKVMVGEEKMSVNELLEKHNAMKEEMAGMIKKPEEEGKPENEEDPDAEAKKKALELAAHEDKEMADKKNAEDKALEDKKNAEDEKKAKEANFNSLKNAEGEAKALQNTATVELSMDRVARGKSRYGSN